VSRATPSKLYTDLERIERELVRTFSRYLKARQAVKRFERRAELESMGRAKAARRSRLDDFNDTLPGA
jgi:hypothetical protein